MKRHMRTIMSTFACSNLKCNRWRKQLQEKYSGYGFKIFKITYIRLQKPRRNKVNIPMSVKCKKRKELLFMQPLRNHRMAGRMKQLSTFLYAAVKMTKIDTELHSHAAAGSVYRSDFHTAPQKYTAFLTRSPTNSTQGQKWVIFMGLH